MDFRKRKTVRATVKRLMAEVDDLLNPSPLADNSIDRNSYVNRVRVVRQKAWESFMLRELSGLATKASELVFPQLLSGDKDEPDSKPKMLTVARGMCAPGLRILQDLLAFSLEFRPAIPSQTDQDGHKPLLPPQNGRGKTRAKTIALVYERLVLFKGRFDGQDYQRLQQQDSGLAAVLGKAWSVAVIEEHLLEATSSRAKLQMAISFAASYHERKEGTIKDDWKHHKPNKFRRFRKNKPEIPPIPPKQNEESPLS
jgi:hypothetical protein